MIDANMPPRPSLSLSAIGSPLRGHPCRPATGGGWSKPVRRASGLHQKRASAAFFPHLVLVFCLCPGFFPVLHAAGHYEEWAEVLGREYESFAERVSRRDNEVMDEYGLTSPAEFFAVATESFFEKGPAMQKRLPDLYEQLKKFYAVDPASWARD